MGWVELGCSVQGFGVEFRLQCEEFTLQPEPLPPKADSASALGGRGLVVRVDSGIRWQGFMMRVQGLDLNKEVREGRSD